MSDTPATTVKTEGSKPAIDDRPYKSWNITQAAAFLHVHPDTLSALARAGEIPAAKIGRAWVFLPALLEEYVKSRSTAARVRHTGGSASVSLAERLAARRAQATAARRTAQKRKAESGS